MRIFLGTENLDESLRGAVMTIGNFDGLHLGHRKIISKVTDVARESRSPSIVMTFDPHPKQVLSPTIAFKPLFTREDLARQLEVFAVDALVIFPFTEALSKTSPEAFINYVLLDPINPSRLVVGYDFTFGVGRAGTLSVLRRLLEPIQIGLDVVPAQKEFDEIVSSSRIRQALTEGDVGLATQMLGRRFYVEGEVVAGDGRGKSIGVPTANIACAARVVPKAGVYSGWLRIKSERFKAVANVGSAPTFHGAGSPLKVEVHAFDFERDLYGEKVEFEFHNRIRNEMKFAGPAQLVEQIKKDIVIARRSLAN